MLGNEPTIAAVKGFLVSVEHALENGEEGVVGDREIEEGIDDPGARRGGVLLGEFKGVALKKWEDVWNREHSVVEVEASAEDADLVGDDLVGFWCVAVGLSGLGGVGEGFVVGGGDEVLPGGADVGRVAMVGGVVDEEAEVVVGGLIGVLVVEGVEGEDGAVELGEEGFFARGADAGVGFQAEEEVGLDVG